MRKRAIIVGAGVAGLCAGVYLQKNGYDTEIFELHAIPGGLCTSWNRKGYTFDGCIHWLCHTKPEGVFHKLWSEVMDFNSLEFAYHDTYMTVEDAGGNRIPVYCDMDRLARELKSLAPGDRRFIDEFTSAAKGFGRLRMPVEKPFQFMSPIELLDCAPSLIGYVYCHLKWGRIAMSEFCSRAGDASLRSVLSKLMPENFSALTLIATLSDMHRDIAGYPIGGSLNFARMIEKRYLELGGEVSYGARVEKILVEDDRARGVMLQNGDQRRADMVISAADGRATIYDMLDGRYANSKLDRIYSGRHRGFQRFPSLIQVSLGVARAVDEAPHWTIKELREPFPVDPETSISALDFRVYNFDSTLAPKGKTCIVSHLGGAGYRHWSELRARDRSEYKAAKQRIADFVIDILDERLGHIRDKVEVADVATPATYERYTDVWNGAYESWMPTPEGMRFKNLVLDHTLPGLDDFYMAGQWVQMAGGLPSCVMSARRLVQILCKQDSKTFGP